MAAQPSLWQLSLTGGAAFRDVSALLSGLTYAEASAQVPSAPYTAAQLLAHIAATMRVSLDLISGRARGWPEDLDVWPDPGDTERFAALLGDLNLMLTEAQMLAADPTAASREILLDLAVHNAYHWGQLALLRQQQGYTFAAQT